MYCMKWKMWRLSTLWDKNDSGKNVLKRLSSRWSSSFSDPAGSVVNGHFLDLASMLMLRPDSVTHMQHAEIEPSDLLYSSRTKQHLTLAAIISRVWFTHNWGSVTRRPSRPLRTFSVVLLSTAQLRRPAVGKIGKSKHLLAEAKGADVCVGAAHAGWIEHINNTATLPILSTVNVRNAERVSPSADFISNKTKWFSSPKSGYWNRWRVYREWFLLVPILYIFLKSTTT